MSVSGVGRLSVLSVVLLSCAACGGDSRSTRDLLREAFSPEPRIDGKAMEELVRRWPKSGPEVIAALSDPDEAVEVTAGRFLMRRDVRPVMQELRRLRSGSAPGPRLWATLVLVPWEKPSAGAADTLAEAIESGAARHRDEVLYALAIFWQPKGMAPVPPTPALLRALKGCMRRDEFAVFDRAQRALARFPPEVSVPVLIEALSDPVTRRRAIDALGRMGPAAAAAIPALERIMVPPEGEEEGPWPERERNRAEAWKALEKIRGR